MKPGKTRKAKGKPKFDHKSGELSRLLDLLTDWFGAHKADAMSQAGTADSLVARRLRRKGGK